MAFDPFPQGQKSMSSSRAVVIASDQSPVSVAGTVGASVIGLTPVAVTNIPAVITNNASVITVAQASVGVAIVSGSIAATFTPPANQSVSGTVQTDVRGSVAVAIISGSVAVATGNSSVQVLNFPTTQNVSGSVVGFQGTSPWVVTANNNSIIATVQGSIATAIISGSVAVATGNSSVQVLNFPTTQNISGSVVGFQGTSPWVITANNNSVIGVQQGSVAVAIISGSIAATFTPPANQSVSGTVQTDVRASVATVIIGGSIATATTNSSVMLLNGANTIGSVTTLQGTNPWIITGSVQGSFSPSGNQSVSGTVQVDVRASVGAVIIGGSIATATTNSSVMLLNSTNVIGSVISYQGSTPWAVAGSVAAFQAGTWITSVVNTVPSSVQTGVSVIGIAPVTLTANTTPPIASILVGVTANTNGSVLTTTGYTTAGIQITSGPGASITAAINFEGTIDGTEFVPIQGYNRATNAISSMATVEGNWVFNTATLQGIRARVSNWSVGSITARATLSPADARTFATNGSVTAFQGTSPWNIAGSVAAFVVGSSSVITVSQGSSILAVPVGSTITVLQTPSIVGTYAEDAGHTTGDKGIFALGVRNDMATSIISADIDYGPLAVDSFGRTVIKPFAPEDATIISYTGSVVSTSVTLIQASAIGKRSYITDFWVANVGSASVTTLITFQGGDTSIVGYTVAPGGGGSNSQGIAIPLKTTLSQDLAFKATTAASVIYMTVKGYQAP